MVKVHFASLDGESVCGSLRGSGLLTRVPDRVTCEACIDNPAREETVLRIAIAHHGMDAQLDQLTEEAAEVITAVNHLRRDREGAMQALIVEMAQLRVMLDQFRLLLGPAALDLAYAFEINRLRDKLGLTEAKETE